MADSPSLLVVDDDPTMAESLVALLESAGYRDIETLNEPHAAVAHINAREYDVVFLDVMMPGMTGFELLDALERTGMDTAFIILTGDASMESAIKALRRGAADYLRKPCDPDELLIRLQNVLDQRRLAEDNRQITAENERLELQLRQSRKMEAIGSLAGGIAHDFNNILGIIVGNAELVQLRLAEDDRVQQNLSNILLASNRAQDLINQLLTFSRPGSGAWAPLELNAVITECLSLIRASIPSNIELRGDVGDVSFFIQGDATQIHQIVINLCTNAAHAMESDGGILEVRLEDVGTDHDESAAASPTDFICLRVADTGAGIEPQVLDRIFDPYFTTKEVGRGSGMGLPVVHGIVKNHGGEIRVDSEPGRGSEFRVYLPLTEAVAGDDDTDPDEVSGGSERILVVDDEEMVVDVVSQMIERLGYEVEAFTDSRTALEHFSAEPDRFDLVLTDLTMPGMSGETLAAEVRRLRAGTPIILCSGFGHKLDETTMTSLGIRELITKPIASADLARALRRHLDAVAADRRRYQRFVTTGGAFVIYRSGRRAAGKLVDVSLGGLAFNYDVRSGEPDPEVALSIVLGSEEYEVPDLPCHTVADTDVASDDGRRIRRRSMRFETLSRLQMERLGRLIEEHAVPA